MEHFRLTTDDVLPADAVEHWAEAVLPQLEARMLRADPRAFTCTMSGRRRAQLAIANVAISSYSGIWRENARLIGNEDSLRVLRVHSGRLAITDQSGQDTVLTPGGCFICGPDAALSYEIAPTERGGVAMIGDMTTIPLRELKSFGSLVPRNIASALSRRPETVLFNCYVDVLRSEITSDSELKRMIQNFTELAALTLCNDPSDEKKATPLLDAHFHRALDLIRERSSDGSFNILSAAKELRLSERLLFKAFEAREKSFHEYVIESRLAAAARRLRAPIEAATVATIAYECGFESISAFNRNFKIRFGMSPREYRMQALALHAEAAH